MVFSPPFAPQFFLLLGIDFFLGNSVLTVMLDKRLPDAVPYVLEIASFIGFAELWVGPTIIGGIPPELQFYYSFVYCMISVLSVIAVNVYLLLVRGSILPGLLTAAFATIPSVFVSLSLASYFVNSVQVPLPWLPVVDVEWVPALSVLGIVILLAAVAYPAVSRRVR
ncbi:MAG: hypothetical protein HY247_04960 [archaeon]|nr:MAG: hypothetical protein HY247_04960 [archaeon]